MPMERNVRHLQVVPAASTSTDRSFSAVYRSHVAFVVRTVRNLGIPDLWVDDVVHDVFLVVHRRLDEYDWQAPVRAWLYGIARRVVMHHRRRNARQQQRERHGPQPAVVVDPERQVAQNQAGEWIEAFLQQLDEPQRTVFVLSDIEGMRATEIAEATGVKLNTVYSRLRLARQRFERALKRHAAISSSDGGRPCRT